MYRKINLLDCTLRDGGYMNDWRFGNYTIRSVVTRLDNAGVDIIECGFLDSRCKYDKDRSMFPDIPSVANTLSSSLPKRALLVAMIDYGTFGQELLIPRQDAVLDGIRLIFKKENVDGALNYAREIKRLGYKLFLNPVALTSYRDMELLTLIEKINEVEPYAMSIVDTYGVMFDEVVEKCIALINSNLKRNVILGYHSHFNLRMSDALCLSFVKKEINRDICIDTTVLGMGKNAGNASTDVVCSMLDKLGIKGFDVNQIFECAYTDISKFFTKPTWGYCLDYVLTAIHDCSPNWIKFLMNKNTLSIQGIRAILDSLPYEKREVSYFNRELAEQKYVEYMDKYVNDSSARASLQESLGDSKILLLCPGKTLRTHKQEIDEYIAEHNPAVIMVNFITDIYHADFAFISNSNRYSQMLGIVADLEDVPKILLTSNIVVSDKLAPESVFNYKTLYEDLEGDNSAGLLISLLKGVGVRSITVAGMDGFDINNLDASFFDINMRLGKTDDANEALVTQLRRVMTSDIDVEWITPSTVKGALGK